MLLLKSARTRALVVAAAAALVLGACGGGSNSESTDKASSEAKIDKNATLRYGTTVPISGLDPHKVPSDIAQLPYTSLLYDRLTQIGDGPTLEPSLATEWKFAADGLSADFTLRDDVKFSDGTVLDAAAVKTSLDRAVFDKTSTVAAKLSMIKSVEVVDPLTVKIATNRQASDLPYALAGGGASIISPKAINNADLDVKPVGSGPYTLAAISLGKSIEFDRVASPWDPKTGLAKKIEITSLTDDNARLNALKTGQIDFAQVKAAQVEDAKNLGAGFEYYAYPAGANYSILLNAGKAPLDDVKVRQALNFAVDREGINKALLNGVCAPATQTLTKGTAGYLESPPVTYTFDQEKAKQLLKEAGVTDGFEMDILVGSGLQPQGAIATAVQAQLAEVGVKAKIAEVDAAGFLPLYGQEDHFSLMTSRLGSATPVTTLRSNFLNPAYMPAPAPAELTDFLGAASDPSVTDDDRLDALESSSALINEQALDIFLCDVPTMIAVSDKVVGADEIGSLYFTGMPNLRSVGLLAD